MRRAVHARVDALTPAVELVLEVQSVSEAPAGLEVAVQEAVTALERPFGRSVARVEDDPAERELPAEGQELLRRAPARGDRALAVPDELPRQGAEPLKAAPHSPRDVGEFLGEDECTGEGA